MGFSKKQHLQQNIDALRIAFQLEKEKRRATAGERLLMIQYSGFGGLKFVLNPIANEIDINSWRKTEHDLFPITCELHQLLQENSEDEKQYRRYVDSMKSSVLTAFYTPPQVIDAISTTLHEGSLNIDKFLEPSAGIGSFIQSFSENQKINVTAYEKDLLTGKILQLLYPESKIRIGGFEEIFEKEQNSYDVVASNIPFGDTSVFDLSYSRSKDGAKVQAARSIHNYFFLKGADMLREGGLLAYITSQGILNSPKNEPIRRALMQDNNLVSVVRLPNNLFTEYAGTEVGSDLIILQKNTSKQKLTEIEELFCQSMPTEFNTPGNAYFQDSSRIVHTDQKPGTDPYGQLALDFNLGERWMPTGIYARFASNLLDTDVVVHYSESADDFSVKCDRKNLHIWEKYAVKSESRTFDGIALLKHALVNTTPDITKKIKVGDQEVKVRDTEAIQMANTKIDEIRTAFSDWLHAQNDEFKNRLTDQYNDTFNCFVRPNYDGTHQDFPGLDRKALGIEDLYSSQKDTVWMIKLNNGAICDHEVGAGKTLVMCTAAQEMNRLGLAHKPMIIGLKSNVHDIRVNRFLVQGEGNIKYTYNNGLIAKDEKLAAMNFLNALEKLPSYIDQEQKKIAEIQMDLPVLQEVISGIWSKENRLSELKTELASVERKIQLSIAPEATEEPREQSENQPLASKDTDSTVGQKGIRLQKGQ